ncbi:MAG TPA: SDR family oxidoreductase [Caulobacteraceae bacterium]|nr:SDR family oxidoreductase [Caulobacteraceae bacterium]
MRVFLTGATGWIGSAIVLELQSAGHQVLGLARSDENVAALTSAGVEPHRGDLEDLDRLAAGAGASDGVIHCGFIHDFSRFAENMAMDRRAVDAMLDALDGSGKPFVIASGLVGLAQGRPSTEDDPPAAFGRGETEEVVRKAADRGIRSGIVRLPPTVHGVGDRGFIQWLVDIARSRGVSGYIGDGANRWSAVHRLDAARLFALALEKGRPGSRYHAIGDIGVAAKDIAAAIGRGLDIPVASIPAEAAAAHFDGFMAIVFALDGSATAESTQAALDWRPEQPELLADLAGRSYFEGRSKYAVA